MVACRCSARYRTLAWTSKAKQRSSTRGFLRQCRAPQRLGHKVDVRGEDLSTFEYGNACGILNHEGEFRSGVNPFQMTSGIGILEAVRLERCWSASAILEHEARRDKMELKFSHVDILVKDLDAAVSYYRRVLSCTASERKVWNRNGFHVEYITMFNGNEKFMLVQPFGWKSEDID